VSTGEREEREFEVSSREGARGKEGRRERGKERRGHRRTSKRAYQNGEETGTESAEGVKSNWREYRVK
jgi:hypothetical protein